MKLASFGCWFLVAGMAWAEPAAKPVVKSVVLSPKVVPPCCRVTLPAGPVSDRSLYQLESKWTSDVGREMTLGQLRGHAQVVGMFYTHCEYACPILVGQMKKLEAALPKSLQGKVDFLLISFDSERDTPAVLAQYRSKRGLGLEHWTLLHGGSDDVREVAALLGINYQSDARGHFAHSNTLTVLNAGGEIVWQQAGLDTAPEQIMAALGF